MSDLEQISASNNVGGPLQISDELYKELLHSHEELEAVAASESGPKIVGYLPENRCQKLPTISKRKTCRATSNNLVSP